MIRQRFNFSLTQLLLLTALAALLAGLLAASRREVADRYLRSLTFSPDGRFLAAEFVNGGVRVWDLSNDSTPTRVLSLPDAPYGYLAENGLQFISPAKLVVLRLDYTPKPNVQLIQWDVVKDRLVKNVALPLTGSETVQVAYGERNSVAASYPGKTQAIDLWDLETGRPCGAVPTASIPLNLVMSPDVQRCAVVLRPPGQSTHSVEVWDVQAKTPVLTVSSKGYTVALSDDGQRMAVSRGDGEQLADVWNVGSGQHKAIISDSPGPGPHTIDLSPNGSLLATVDYVRGARVWDTSTGQLLGEFEPADNVVFSPDGQQLAVGKNNEISLWDTTTFRHRTLTRSRAMETAILFSAGLLVWAVAWGVVERRRRERDSTEASLSGASLGTDKLSPGIEFWLRPGRVMLGILAKLILLAVVLAYLLAGAVSLRLGISYIGSVVLVFLVVLIGAPLIGTYIYYSPRSYRRLVHGHFADALTRARMAAGATGRTKKFGMYTLAVFGDSQLEPIVQQVYQTALQRFWDVIGKTYLPKQPLLILIFDRKSAIDTYAKGRVPLPGVYFAGGERQIVMCEKAALNELTEPRRLLQSLLTSYLLHDYKGFLAQPWVQLLVGDACEKQPTDLPKTHRALRVVQQQEDKLVGTYLFTTSSREFFELLLACDEFPAYRRMHGLRHQAVSLSQYLLGDDSGDKRERFRELLSDLKARDNCDEVFRRHCGCGYSQLLDDWQQWYLAQETEPTDTLPDVLQGHLDSHLVPLIRNEKAPRAERIRAVRDIGSSVCIPAAGVLIEIVEAGPSHLLYQDALWSLETLAGESFGADAARWQAWWKDRPKPTTAGAPCPALAAAKTDDDHAAASAEDSTDANGEADPHDTAVDRAIGATASVAAPEAEAPPADSARGLLRSCQFLIGIAGGLAIWWSAGYLMYFNNFFTDTFWTVAGWLYGSLAGVYAVTRVAAGDRAGMKTAATLLAFCWINCNVISTFIALFGKALLKHYEVQQRLAATIPPPG